MSLLRRFWHWEHSALVMLIAACVAEWLLLGGCAPRPQAREPVVADTPHCFRLTFAFDGRTESAVACASSESLCRNAQARAVRFGGLMRAKEVGQCRSE